MNANLRVCAPAPRRSIITLRIVAALALSGLCLPAAAAPVFNCADAGTGSLRAAIAAAQSGTTIDLSSLQCSSITLATGALNVAVDNLTLVGPPAGFTINAPATNPYSRVVYHSGTGTLTISNMTLHGGRTQSGRGGCLYSAGDVVLDHVNVIGCVARLVDPPKCPALGGGVFTQGNLNLMDSTIAHSGVDCYSSMNVIPSVRVEEYGGGAFSFGDMSILRSTITANIATDGALGSHDYGYGGGISAVGNIAITDSTIANNQAGSTNCFYSTSGVAGGVFARIPTSSVTITNSTISGNTATSRVGGIFSFAPLKVYNSTIAFNSTSADSISYLGHDYAPGIHIQETTATLQSSIVANNTFDACNGNFLADLTGLNATLSGSNNLIMGSTIAPPGSLTADPQLEPLANNGGPTQTHKIGPSSPAIAHGSNPASLSFDQRGHGFARTFRDQTDIGAYQTGDSPFNNGFQ